MKSCYLLSMAKMVNLYNNDYCCLRKSLKLMKITVGRDLDLDLDSC